MGFRSPQYTKIITMKIKIKKLNEMASIPTYATLGSAGMDLTATEREYIAVDEEADFIEYKTGLALEIPEGFVGLIFPRSSNSKKNLTLCNSVGVIDSDYRGEIRLRYEINVPYDEFLGFMGDQVHVYDEQAGDLYPQVYEVGDKIGQLVILPYPKIYFEEDELLITSRGEGGFGHTGK